MLIVWLFGNTYVHRMGICDHKRETGMLFCDHSTPIEAISVAKPSKNNSLHSKSLAKTMVNIYS